MAGGVRRGRCVDVSVAVAIDGPTHRRLVHLGRPALLDPSYADATVFINPGDNWQTKIDGQSAGTEENPVIFGVTQGTHVRADALGATPKSHHWFVGESDGVPTTQFPNGSPISVVTGDRFAAPGSDFFLAYTVGGTPRTGVKIVMLEIDGFAPPSSTSWFMGGNAESWYYSHVNQHHGSEGSMYFGRDYTHLRHCWIHHNGRSGPMGNEFYKGSRVVGAIVEYCTVEYNNQLEYAPNVAGSHAGGSKWLNTEDMTVRYCDFSRNGGPGIWFDFDSTGTHIHHNTCWDNELGIRGGSGIFYEINDAATGAIIEENDCRRNGDAANIYISNSRGSAANPIKVRNNYTENHRQWEIMCSNVDRDPSPHLDWTEITDNTMVHTELLASSGGARALTGAYIPDAGEEQLQDLNVSWDRNTYIWDPGVMGHSIPFMRNASGQTFSNWQGFGYDPNSSYQEV